jgi:hypothetical protein
VFLEFVYKADVSIRDDGYRVSRAGIGVQAVRRYGSGQIGYRAMYVRIGNPVVCSIDRT